MMKMWLYDGAPETYLHYEDALRDLKDGLEKGYFEQLIREAFLENTHEALVMLAPSRTVSREREAAQEKILADKKAAMSAKDLARVIEDCAALKAAQEAPDTAGALATISPSPPRGGQSAPARSRCRLRCEILRGQRYSTPILRRAASSI